MKIVVVYLLGFLAVASAELKIYPGGSISYQSPNVQINLQKSGDSSLNTQSPDFSKVASLQTYSMENELMLARPQMNFSQLKLSKEGMEEIITALGHLAAQIEDGIIGPQAVRVTPKFIQYQDQGMEIVLTTYGLAYMRLASGVIVQITPTGLVVKDKDGSVKSMDLTPVSEELRTLSAALDAEAKHWIYSGP